MKRFSFNQTIFFQNVLFLFLLVVPFISCKKEEFNGPLRNYSEIRDRVVQATQKKLTVDALGYKDKVYSILFSNGDTLVVPSDSVTVLTVDLSGCWCINQDSSYLIPKSENEIAPLINNTKIILAEGYTDWTFYFSDYNPVVLTKTLFSYDADAIIKGVNHRGYNIIAPENTLPAYRLSKLQGFNYVETDIRFTSDGVPVLLHDESINRTSNGQGRIQDMSFEEVRSFDFGSWKAPSFNGTQIPSLEEFLSLCAEIGLSPHLELKEGTQKQVSQIISLVEQFGLSDRVVYISFNLNLLKYVLQIMPNACVGVLTRSVNESVVSNTISMRTKFNNVYISASDYSENAISLCRQSELPLGVWVVDSKEIILSLPRYVSSVSSDNLHAGRILYEAGQK